MTNFQKERTSRSLNNELLQPPVLGGGLCLVWRWEDDDHRGAPEADTLVHRQVLGHLSLSLPGAQSGEHGISSI